jgi:uncharacterized protein YodC (DUF2158 family)
MNQIKIGNMVRLKSGGPLMTVAKTFTDTKGVPTARCDWFDGNNPLWGSFPISSLKVEE